MNLAIKLYITNPEQTSLLCQYIFNLARYDQNYDIRDKARLLKQFVPAQDDKIRSQVSRIFLASKPAPLLQSHFRGSYVYINNDYILTSLLLTCHYCCWCFQTMKIYNWALYLTILNKELMGMNLYLPFPNILHLEM